MLNAAMVLMILAGLFGLPAVICSGACSGLGYMAEADKSSPGGQAIVDFFLYLSLAASIGSIIVGALVKKLKKALSGILCFGFALCFAFLLFQGNFFGLVSSFLLVISGIMIFVAPAEQFTGVSKVKVVTE
ncbi:MAG: hypothetical protein JRJ14_07255 [Deltaproteobacteria bacterium]|nr:hypothetical protein [Deltaproteobacteria bacterium]